jgi:hypothetical protein
MGGFFFCEGNDNFFLFFLGIWERFCGRSLSFFFFFFSVLVLVSHTYIPITIFWLVLVDMVWLGKDCGGGVVGMGGFCLRRGELRMDGWMDGCKCTYTITKDIMKKKTDVDVITSPPKASAVL